MKVRIDFVSNSSSSSFITICDTNIEKYNFNYQDIEVPNACEGKSQFGWEVEDSYDIWSKINFCAIQLIDLKDREEYLKKHPDQQDYSGGYAGKSERLIEMFKSVCSEVLHLDIVLRTQSDIDSSTGSMWAYIDHQSSVIEGANMEMFESKESLINFLTSRDSYIHTDNDNRDPDENY